MFSGTGTAPTKRVGTPRRVGSRAASRAASQALRSGETTPRAGSPPPGTGTGTHATPVMSQYGPGVFGHHSTGRAGSVAGGRRRAKSSVAASSDAGAAFVDNANDDDDDDERRSIASAVARTTDAEGVDKVLVRDDNYVVLERKALPVEVQQVMANADPYTDPFRASLDHVTGFAYLVTRDFCFVWPWTKRSSSSTTYVFPLPTTTSLPANVSIYTPLAYASFVTSSTSTGSSQREPGLLVVSTTGELRHWDSLSMALSGVDRFHAASLALPDTELVRGLTAFSPTSYLVSTSRSRVILVALTSVGGRVDVNIRPLERSVGWAGSVWSAVFGAKESPDPTAGILALAASPIPSSPEGGKHPVYAVSGTDVHVWDVPSRDDGSERLVVEQDILAGVLEALGGSKVGNEAWAMNERQATILDAGVTSSGHLALLVSHVESQTATNSLSYAIVVLDVGSTQNSVSVVGVRHLLYQAPTDPRPLSSPKLSLGAGSIAFVVFVDAVVMTSLEEGSSFEESFPLRFNSNRFLGFSTRSPSNESLALLTSSGSILSVQINSAALAILGSYAAPGSEAAKTRKLKTKIEQAVYFGADDASNPLAFDLLPDFEGDLVIATEAVSSEILSSSSPHAPLIMDLRAQLADRVQRAKALIAYIGANGLLGKLSQSARRQLSWDAERLVAAVPLWHHQNSRIGAASSPTSLLAYAITMYTNSTGDVGPDPVRSFFRTRVGALANVLEEVHRLAKTALGGETRSEQKSQILHEANQTFLLVFNAVARYRKDSATQYALNPDVLPLEAWSSRAGILEALSWQFEHTDLILRERVRELGSSLEDTGANEQQNLQGELKKQMVGLAEYVFSVAEERLLFLQTGEGEDMNSVRAREFLQRYLSQRAKFVKMLVGIGKVGSAYELAERHRDFRALVELCTDPRHGSSSRLDFLLRKYEQDFAFPLYQYYVERGQLRTLLEQDEVYRPLLTRFLDETENTRISWINDIAVDRYAQATIALVSEAQKELDLVQKKVMLSLGKLSQVAQATRETLATEQVQRAIEAIDDKLDLVNTQSTLQQAFLSVLPSTSLHSSLSAQSQQLTHKLVSHLSQPLQNLFHRLTLQLLSSQTLSSEDLIDLLTLPFPDSFGSSSSNGSGYCTALEILLRSHSTLPQTRFRIALETIWRRIYLADEWDEINRSRQEGELSDEDLVERLRRTALYSTLKAIRGGEMGEVSVLTPQEAVFEGWVEEDVAPRFEGVTMKDVKGVMEALEEESKRLMTDIDREGLGEYCKEVERLLLSREVDGEVEDIVMV